jgi:transcriptional regulator with PAS, ATPase and Fis domain
MFPTLIWKLSYLTNTKRWLRHNFENTARPRRAFYFSSRIFPVPAVTCQRGGWSQSNLNEELSRVKGIASYLQEELDRKSGLPAELRVIAGKSSNFMDALGRAAKASRSDVTVMIRGETGVGKELLAKAVHGASRKKQSVYSD